MNSPSELLLIDGISFEDYQTLRPYVSALPRAAPVNVNTAPAAVLQALVPGLAAADAEQLVSEREDNPFAKVEDFSVHGLIQPHMGGGQNTQVNNSNGLSVSSEYFLLNAEASYERVTIQMASVIARDVRGTWILQHGQGEY
jgi:general secretion pathway protein K